MNTETPEFHNTIYLQGPHRPTASLVESGGFATVDTSGASIFVHDRAEADALIKAFLAARDLLPEPEPGPQRCLNCGAREGEPCRDWCAYKPGGRAMTGDEGPPALSRDLSGDLDAIPANRIGEPAPLAAAGHCPICGAELAADGSHISAASGAHIPAEPQQVST